MLNGAELRVPCQLEGVDTGGAGFGEHGGHLRQLLGGGGGANAFVGTHLAVVLKPDGYDRRKPALLTCVRGALLAGERHGVCLFSANAVQAGDQVSTVAHHQHAALCGELRVDEHTGLVCQHGYS